MKLRNRSKKLDPSLDARVRAFLAACPAAISGQGGSHQTFSVACALAWGFALSEGEALAWLRVYNQRCEPPWSDAELKQKLRYAARSEYHDKPRGHLL
jgi:hypothetical protein